jgi:non-specific serine/threonine protein kinase
MGIRAGAGTFTLLFTDLVGSTESLVALGEDRFDSVRDEHDALVGRTITAHHGELVKHTGDGYMAVFTRAGDAVSAAAEIQRLISTRNHGSEAPLGVRIGISAGDVTERAGDYHGVAAVEAARLCSVAMGGQVLASETVRSLVGSAGGHEFVALGELDLKGLPPVVTAALRWSEDATVIAPARGARGNLPASVDRFVGRRRDLEAIRGLLDEVRLVTLTGPGGSGKTRLALEVARAIGAERADGVWLVELAAINDENLVAEATMAALGLRGRDAPARDVVRSHLARRDALLVVDNCEHVLDGAAGVIAELLATCPRVRVLATSRESLRVPGEAEYSVEALVREEATELLAERVRGRDDIDDADAAERICCALEGIPLAIELAAAKLRVLSLAQLADRLDDQLAVLARGARTAPERQRTLRATLDWSYDLLDDDERVALRRVAIFAGGFGTDAAERVVADDRIPRAQVLSLLERLVERSLLTRVPGGVGARLRLLEPVRQYAGEQLDEAGERHALARRHLEWVRDFAQLAFLEFWVSQCETVVRLREEHANISQALEFAIGNRDGITAATIIAPLSYPWFTSGQPDALLWCQRVLAVVPDDAPPTTRAGALVATGMMLGDGLEKDAAESLLLEALELSRSAKDVLGEAWALSFLGVVAFHRAHESPEAKDLLEAGLSRWRELEIPPGVGWCLAFLAEVALYADDDALARIHAEEVVQLGRSEHIGQVLAMGLFVLARLDSRAGNFESADQRLAESITIHEAADDRGLLLADHVEAAELAAYRDDIGRATTHLTAGADLVREMSWRARWLVGSAAYVAYKDGRAGDAAVLFGACRGLDPSTFPKRFRPILEALENQGLHEEIAAGANLSVDEALEHVAALTLDRPVDPAAQDDRTRVGEPQPMRAWRLAEGVLCTTLAASCAYRR